MRLENFEIAKSINFIFCSHPLNKKNVDENYMEEYQATGLDHACALFSYEDLVNGKLSLYGEDIEGLTIYRGWMMPAHMYELFYNLLLGKGIQLINSPKEYAKYHLLPGWYSDFEGATPFSIWNESRDIRAALELTEGLEGAFVVKDYVKSRKHEWHDACFIKDISDKEDTFRVINNFINRQGSNLEGGVVLRKFESLKSMGRHKDSGMPISEEYRVFVFKGEILISDNYWSDNEEVNISEDEYIWIESISGKIESNFVTIDLARKTDGKLIIMEMGDGQVSGLQQIDAYEFYGAFQNQGKGNIYSIDYVKEVINELVKMGFEPELSLCFRGNESEYMIIVYADHVSFQRCGYYDGSGEIEYKTLDELFEADIIDGICLKRDWNKIVDILCSPSMIDFEFKKDKYKKMIEQSNREWGDRGPIFKIVKKEIDKWNPYGLLPEFPNDEFDGESTRIASDIDWNSTTDKIAKLISNEFTFSFGDEYMFSLKCCIQTAKNIRDSMDRFIENKRK
jgi:hypothetical protein